MRNSQMIMSEKMTEKLDDQSRGTILVADDDPLSIAVISTVLNKAGWKVETAEDGGQALNIIDTVPLSGLILDMRMPKLDGYEVCLNLLRRGRNIPTLVITSCIGDSEPLGHLNVVKTVRKPVAFEDLLQFVETINPLTPEAPSHAAGRS